MKGLDYFDNDPELEAELRATLRRRAADVRPNPPAWHDLLDRSRAVVVSLHTGRTVDPAEEHRRYRRRERDWAWLRPALAAAACLAVVMAAGVFIGRSTTPGDDGGGTAGQPTDAGAESAPLAAAGEPGFSAATAPPLLNTPSDGELYAQFDETGGLAQDFAWMATPEDAGLEYLLSTEIATEADPAVPRTAFTTDPDLTVWYEPSPEIVQQRGSDGTMVETTLVWWTLRRTEGALDPGNPPVVTEGRVMLRNLTSPADASAPEAWTVVGAKTAGLDLTNVHRDGDQLEFTVTTSRGVASDEDLSGWPVEVLVNGQALPPTEPLEPFEPKEFEALVPMDAPARVTVRHRGENGPLSVTDTTFLPDVERLVAEEEARAQAVVEDMEDMEDRMADAVVTPGGATFGMAVLSEGCAPDAELVVTIQLPDGFSTEPVPGDVGGDVPATLVCRFRFDDLADQSGGITVGWGPPPIEMPVETQGPECLKWAALDDGGFVAAREEPYPMYTVAEGLTEEEFAQVVESTELSVGWDTWSAADGC